MLNSSDEEKLKYNNKKTASYDQLTTTCVIILYFSVSYDHVIFYSRI